MDKHTRPRLAQVSSVGTPSSLVGSQASMAGSQATVPGSGASVVSAQAVGRPGSGAPLGQAAPDIKAMLHRVVAHWYVVLLTFCVGGLTTCQVVRVRKPTYKSETVITYHEGIAKSIAGSGEPTENVRTLGTKLKETLLAHQTLRKIIEEQKLYPDIVAKTGYADAVDQMRKKIDFKSRSVDTFAISFEGTDKVQAQKVCARMAEILKAETARRLSDENKGTTEFLEVEKRRADEELDKVEREISAFLQAHPEFATSQNALGTETIAKQKAEDEEKRAAMRRSGPARAPSRSRTDAPAAALPTPGDGAAAVDPVLLTARAQANAEVVAAQKDLADKSLRYTDQHPDVRNAKDRLAAAQAQLQRANDAIAAAQPAEAPAPHRRAAPVADDPYGDGAKPAPAAAAAVMPDDKPKPKPKASDADQGDKSVSLEVEWARLGRVLTLARAHQVDLENKLYKAEMAASTTESGYGTTIAVLDQAYPPSGPSNAPNLTVVIIGLALSIAVGLAISAAWGLFLDDRLFAPSEVELTVMVPVLGTVPRASRKGKGKDAARAGARQGLSRA